MRLFSKLWCDEAGVLLSAEAVVVGTVAIVGLTTGLTVVAKSVNEELQDVAFAIRSFDQSYSIPAQDGCGAHTAGSTFEQEPVEKSLDELREVVQTAEQEEQKAKSQAERLEQQMKKGKNGDKKKKKEKEQNI